MPGHPARRRRGIRFHHKFDLAAGHPLTHPAVSEPYPDLAGNQSKRRTPPITPTTRTPARVSLEEIKYVRKETKMLRRRISLSRTGGRRHHRGFQHPRLTSCVRKNSEESSTQWITGIAEVHLPIVSDD
uniref:Uncharacterized protein n=1 Tax=Oryza nivara TaxID=4536 RepID=A0A0E0G340_ORYNI